MSSPAGYVYSTATTSMKFRKYGPPVQGRYPEVEYEVTVMGGANCPDKFMRTPRGIATPVTAEQISFLSTNAKFLKSQRKGFMTLARGNSEADLEAVVSGLNAADKSRPRVDSDFEVAPKIGKVAA